MTHIDDDAVYRLHTHTSTPHGSFKGVNGITPFPIVVECGLGWNCVHISMGVVFVSVTLQSYSSLDNKSFMRLPKLEN